MEPYDKDKSREIRLRIRGVLMDAWDPIGVKDIPEAADEYDSYLGDVFELIERDAPITEISDYLRWVETHQMGLGGYPEAERDAVAASLKRLVQK